MYNIYCEEKKLSKNNQKLKAEKELQLFTERHKKKTDSLVNHYQERVKKFIIDMAEENPLIEIKSAPKKIEDTREQYLFENEKLILGNSGFIFRSYPTLKERLEQYNKEHEEYINHNNKRKYLNKSNSMSMIDSYINAKRKQESKIFSQPILRFKNRTDLERICDTLQQHNVNPSEQESLKEIRERHVKSIDFPTGLLYKGGFEGEKKLKKLTRNKKTKNNINLIRSIFSLTANNKEMNNTASINNFNTIKNNTNNFLDVNTKKPKIYFTRLQRLNAEAKKIRSNLHYKTHFKGVESIFLNPKPLYDIIKKDESYYNKKKKIGNFAYDQGVEKIMIEKKNEYKEDIKNLMKEEEEKENIINTKEFTNFLNNKEYYNDRAMINKYEINKKETKDDKLNKIEKLNYIKNLAFDGSSTQRINASGQLNTDSSEDRARNRKKPNLENEQQIRIGGKIYHMQYQMDKIAKEILSKCKFYSKKKI